jgi:hypothetical protein
MRLEWCHQPSGVGILRINGDEHNRNSIINWNRNCSPRHRQCLDYDLGDSCEFL